MKIVYFTPEKPGERSGGQLAVKQTLYYLSQLSSIELVCVSTENFSVFSIQPDFVLGKPSKSWGCIWNFIRYGFWDTSSSKLTQIKADLDSADLIICEFSRNPFFSKFYGHKTLVRWHNIEANYYRHSTANPIMNYVKSFLSAKNERLVSEKSARHIFLTKDDKHYAEETYNIKGQAAVIPIALEDNAKEIDCRRGSYGIITGSLWHEGNKNSIIQFLDGVWRQFKGSRLVIAGSSPSKELLSVVDKMPNVTIVPDPIDMGRLFREASFAIAPINDGAGMKVKIAEALSYGLPVIASRHAAIGYRLSSYLTICDAQQDYVLGIERLLNINLSDLVEIRRDARNGFMELYELDATKSQFFEFLGRE